MRRALAENDQQAALKMWQNARLNKITAMWELRNVFPYNIGSAQLNNNASSLMTIGVSFYFERYRFYASPRFEDDDMVTKIQLPSKGYWDGKDKEHLQGPWANTWSNV